MTEQETFEQIDKAQRTAHRAAEQHVLAFQAFHIACAREQWDLAASEQERAIEAMRTNLDAIQSMYRLRQSL